MFGNDVQIVAEDIPYGDDPVAAIKELIEQRKAVGDTVVAVETVAPFPVLQKLTDAQRGKREAFGCPLIRAEFERDETGRAITTGKEESGRDILKFSHYEELVRIEFQTRRLTTD